jgi:hypothetical protein
MATDTPPPYFPQNALSPPDEKRYRNFKIIVASVALLVLLFIGALVAGVVYLVKWIF